MTGATKQRLFLYPAVFLVLGGLVYGGFIYEAEADVGTLVNSAEVLAQAGFFDQAIDHAERALRQDPDQRYAHIIVGYAYGRKGEHDRACRHYRRAVELTPAEDEKRESLRLFLGEALMEAGRFEEALDVVRSVLDTGAEEYPARLLRGRVLHAAGRAGEAREALEAAAEIDVTDSAPLLLLASLDEAGGDLEAARKQISRARKAAPESLWVLVRLARLQALQGEREESVLTLLAVAGKKRVLLARVLKQEEAFRELREDPRLQAELPVNRIEGAKKKIDF